MMVVLEGNNVLRIQYKFDFHTSKTEVVATIPLSRC